jgi:hypothetical protein
MATYESIARQLMREAEGATAPGFAPQGPLTHTQYSILANAARHPHGQLEDWLIGPGRTQTIEGADVLVLVGKGLMRREGTSRGREFFYITDAGLKALAEAVSEPVSRRRRRSVTTTETVVPEDQVKWVLSLDQTRGKTAAEVGHVLDMATDEAARILADLSAKGEVTGEPGGPYKLQAVRAERREAEPPNGYTLEKVRCPECGSDQIAILEDPKGRFGCQKCGFAGKPDVFYYSEESRRGREQYRRDAGPVITAWEYFHGADTPDIQAFLEWVKDHPDYSELMTELEWDDLTLEYGRETGKRIESRRTREVAWQALDANDNPITTVLADTEEEAKDEVRRQLQKNPSRRAYLTSWEEGGEKVVLKSSEGRTAYIRASTPISVQMWMQKNGMPERISWDFLDWLREKGYASTKSTPQRTDAEWDAHYQEYLMDTSILSREALPADYMTLKAAAVTAEEYARVNMASTTEWQWLEWLKRQGYDTGKRSPEYWERLWIDFEELGEYVEAGGKISRRTRAVVTDETLTAIIEWMRANTSGYPRAGKLVQQAIIAVGAEGRLDDSDIAWLEERAEIMLMANRRTKEADNPLGVERGDLVDFGPYGQLYVVNMDAGGTEPWWWVTEDERQRFNRDAMGHSIQPYLAKRIIERGDDVFEDDDGTYPGRWESKRTRAATATISAQDYAAQQLPRWPEVARAWLAWVKQQHRGEAHKTLEEWDQLVDEWQDAGEPGYDVGREQTARRPARAREQTTAGPIPMHAWMQQMELERDVANQFQQWMIRMPAYYPSMTQRPEQWEQWFEQFQRHRVVPASTRVREATFQEYCASQFMTPVEVADFQDFLAGETHDRSDAEWDAEYYAWLEDLGITEPGAVPRYATQRWASRRRFRSAISEMRWTAIRAWMENNKGSFARPEDLADGALDHFGLGATIEQAEDAHLMDMAYEVMGGYGAWEARQASRVQEGSYTIRHGIHTMYIEAPDDDSAIAVAKAYERGQGSPGPGRIIGVTDDFESPSQPTPLIVSRTIPMNIVPTAVYGYQGTRRPLADESTYLMSSEQFFEHMGIWDAHYKADFKDWMRANGYNPDLSRAENTWVYVMEKYEAALELGEVVRTRETNGQPRWKPGDRVWFWDAMWRKCKPATIKSPGFWFGNEWQYNQVEVQGTERTFMQPASEGYLMTEGECQAQLSSGQRHPPGYASVRHRRTHEAMTLNEWADRERLSGPDLDAFNNWLYREKSMGDALNTAKTDTEWVDLHMAWQDAEKAETEEVKRRRTREVGIPVDQWIEGRDGFKKTITRACFMNYLASIGLDNASLGVAQWEHYFTKFLQMPGYEDLRIAEPTQTQFYQARKRRPMQAAVTDL